jgi:hypothetical protein
MILHQNFVMFEHTLRSGCGWQDFLSLGVLFILDVSNDDPNHVFNVLPMYFQSVLLAPMCHPYVFHMLVSKFSCVFHVLPYDIIFFAQSPTI